MSLPTPRPIPHQAPAPSALLEALPEGFIALDADFRIVYLNEAAERSLGRQRAEVLGRPLKEALPGLYDDLHARRAWLCTHSSIRFQRRYNTGNRSFAINARASQSGGFWLFLQDVSECAQVATRRRPDQLHAFGTMEGSDEGFFVLDGEWRFAYVNARAREIWGRAKRNLRGKVIWEVFPAAVGSDVLLQLRRAAEQRHWTQFITRSLGNRWLELHVHPCGEHLCVYFRRVSTTERKHAERIRLAVRRQISAAQEEERQHIARELHDGAGQLLGALAIGLRALEETRSLAEARQRSVRLRRITARIFDEIDHLMLGLRPTVLRGGVALSVLCKPSL